MANGDGFAHLREHRRDKAETRVGEELCRVERRQKSRRGRCASGGRIGVIRGIRVEVIAGLFKKIKKVFAGNILKQENQIRRGFESAI